MREVGFDRVNTAAYSPRPHTPAALRDDQVGACFHLPSWSYPSRMACFKNSAGELLLRLSFEWVAYLKLAAVHRLNSSRFCSTSVLLLWLVLELADLWLNPGYRWLSW